MNPEEYEINIVLSGRLEVTCQDIVFSLDAGNAAVWWAGLFHRNRAACDNNTEFISIHFTASDIDKSPA